MGFYGRLGVKRRILGIRDGRPGKSAGGSIAVEDLHKGKRRCGWWGGIYPLLVVRMGLFSR